MKIQFTYLLTTGEYDTVKQEIQFKGMTIPLMNASQAMRNTVIQAKIEIQRRRTEQFDAARFLGN